MIKNLFDLKELLYPDKSQEPTDNFRILDAWAEYDDESSDIPEERNLEYQKRTRKITSYLKRN